MVEQVQRGFLERGGRGRLLPVRYWATNNRNGSEWHRRWVWRWFGLRVGFFEHVQQQDWSPAMSEMQITRGLIIGRSQIGVSRRGRIWHDGKEPRIEKTN